MDTGFEFAYLANVMASARDCLAEAFQLIDSENGNFRNSKEAKRFIAAIRNCDLAISRIDPTWNPEWNPDKLPDREGC